MWLGGVHALRYFTTRILTPNNPFLIGNIPTRMNTKLWFKRYSKRIISTCDSCERQLSWDSKARRLLEGPVSCARTPVYTWKPNLASCELTPVCDCLKP